MSALEILLTWWFEQVTQLFIYPFAQWNLQRNFLSKVGNFQFCDLRSDFQKKKSIQSGLFPERRANTSFCVNNNSSNTDTITVQSYTAWHQKTNNIIICTNTSLQYNVAFFECLLLFNTETYLVTKTETSTNY